uniref:Uncharacterized protein n=1 Tax=Candidatus Kentrum sp. FW TaxID=2126338 RepID=A0A450SPS9_9GAMM|nr:MAG: hypothetical protein BECKFW1821B_GA0114236_102517 [Candidatus Kentron sp. FW]
MDVSLTGTGLPMILKDIEAFLRQFQRPNLGPHLELPDDLTILAFGNMETGQGRHFRIDGMEAPKF